MRTETDPGTGRQAGAAALGVVERSDETPRAEDKQPRSAPDPEVVAKPTRRQFTAEYRLRIVEEADRCTRPGEVGRMLRREGLYTSHLSGLARGAAKRLASGSDGEQTRRETSRAQPPQPQGAPARGEGGTP